MIYVYYIYLNLVYLQKVEVFFIKLNVLQSNKKWVHICIVTKGLSVPGKGIKISFLSPCVYLLLSIKIRKKIG